MEYESIKTIYNGYSGVYDLIFKGFFHPRQKMAIDDLDIKHGSKVLDVGVGTGLSLALYPSHCDVTGIDISTKMLNQAHKKIEKLGLSNITLMEMDACNLEFEDDTFDYVIATHIVSVVPEPIRVVSEMQRVAKHGAGMVIVNHFVSSKPWVAKVENFFDPLFRKFGWRMDLSYEDFVDSTKLDVRQKKKLSKVDLWEIVHANNDKRLC